MTTIDIISNLTMPKLDADSALVVALKLGKTVPSDMTPAERKAARAVRDLAAHLEEVQKERDRSQPVAIRPRLLASTNTWSALFTALQAAAKLPADVSPNGAVATRILATLFPDGLAFTMADADTHFAESRRRIARIDEERLAHAIDEIVGTPYLEAVRKEHVVLSDTVGVGRTPPRPTPTETVQSAFSDLVKGMATYVRVLAGSVDESDDTSVTRFLSAIAPITDARPASSRPSTGAPDAPPPPEPPPPAPAPTPAPIGSPQSEPFIAPPKAAAS